MSPVTQNGMRSFLPSVSLLPSNVAAIERVGLFPESGRVVPEANDSALREVVYSNYRIVYRVTPEAVEVVAVYHGARLLRL